MDHFPKAPPDQVDGLRGPVQSLGEGRVVMLPLGSVHGAYLYPSTQASRLGLGTEFGSPEPVHADNGVFFGCGEVRFWGGFGGAQTDRRLNLLRFELAQVDWRTRCLRGHVFFRNPAIRSASSLVRIDLQPLHGHQDEVAGWLPRAASLIRECDDVVAISLASKRTFLVHSKAPSVLASQLKAALRSQWPDAEKVDEQPVVDVSLIDTVAASKMFGEEPAFAQATPCCPSCRSALSVLAPTSSQLVCFSCGGMFDIGAFADVFEPSSPEPTNDQHKSTRTISGLQGALEDDSNRHKTRVGERSRTRSGRHQPPRDEQRSRSSREVTTDWDESNKSAERYHNLGILFALLAPVLLLIGIGLLIFTGRNGIGWGMVAAGPVLFMTGAVLFGMHK